MNKPLSTYIEYLLFQNDCVTIPKFGSFILNKEDELSDCATSYPKYTVVFNQSLKHDDGLLVHTIHRVENLTKEAAIRDIESTVNEITVLLNSGQTVSFGRLGQIFLDEKEHKIFLPSTTIQNPNTFGLKDIRLQKLVERDRSVLRVKRYTRLKYFSAGVAATFLGVLMLFGPTSNISDSQTKTQQSSLIETISALSSNETISTSIVATTENRESQANLNATEAITTTTQSAGNDVVATQAAPSYFIVIGGATNKIAADKMLIEFRSSAFPSAEIIESPDRYRIYVQSFADKKEAETFLIQFRIDNPKYETAWLLSKKSKGF